MPKPGRPRIDRPYDIDDDALTDGEPGISEALSERRKEDHETTRVRHTRGSRGGCVFRLVRVHTPGTSLATTGALPDQVREWLEIQDWRSRLPAETEG